MAGKLVGANDRLGRELTVGFGKMSDGVVKGYKVIETGVVTGYTVIEDSFVSRFLTHPGETVAQAKRRLKGRAA
ncbi:MAG: hypothetical protein IJV41_07915 [Oscillospiraceae bacterium]|nr:hypothetical protein [Oscillospiraceae bacterium]